MRWFRRRRPRTVTATPERRLLDARAATLAALTGGAGAARDALATVPADDLVDVAALLAVAAAGREVTLTAEEWATADRALTERERRARG